MYMFVLYSGCGRVSVFVYHNIGLLYLWGPYILNFYVKFEQVVA